jgi:hypothetical protein
VLEIYWALEKHSPARIIFASITSNGPTLGLGLMTQYISNRMIKMKGIKRKSELNLTDHCRSYTPTFIKIRKFSSM